jgi:hypothetical protein
MQVWIVLVSKTMGLAGKEGAPDLNKTRYFHQGSRYFHVFERISANLFTLGSKGFRVWEKPSHYGFLIPSQTPDLAQELQEPH